MTPRIEAGTMTDAHIGSSVSVRGGAVRGGTAYTGISGSLGTFNPQVVCSSPTRPTTLDLGNASSPPPVSPHFVPVLARCWLAGTDPDIIGRPQTVFRPAWAAPVEVPRAPLQPVHLLRCAYETSRPGVRRCPNRVLNTRPALAGPSRCSAGNLLTRMPASPGGPAFGSMSEGRTRRTRPPAYSPRRQTPTPQRQQHSRA
jgi:hypothetical protein